MPTGQTPPEDIPAAMLEPLPGLAALEARWRALESRCAGSFFQSWTWVGSWLRATGVTPGLVSVASADGGEIGLALLGRSMDKRLLGRVPTYWLNEAGNAAQDRPYVEYNAPLALPEREGQVAHAIAALLAGRRDWRVLRLSGVEPGCALLAAIPARRRILVGRSPAYFVGLDQVRQANGDYPALLSANTRSQIRRSLRDHGDAPPRVTRCGTPGEIAEALADMRRLNQGRHANNAWDDALFLAFASEIANAGLADGSVDILSVHLGERRIGLLLNFVHRGRAMNYQSAFEAPLTAKAKPGLMTHAAAITHYAARGLKLYSLLAGKDRYKQSLATGEDVLEWWMAERFSLKLGGEYWLRRLLGR